jgi:hypothetical protein
MWVKPQLCKLVPRGPEWLHEIKYDGYRMHARLDRGRAQTADADRPAVASPATARHSKDAARSGSASVEPVWFTASAESRALGPA